MEEINEDDLIMYEESKEKKETLWKIWDIVNDKKIVLKLLLNTNLANDLKAARTQTQILDSIETTKEKEIKEINNILENNDRTSSEVNQIEENENGNYYIFNIFVF